MSLETIGLLGIVLFLVLVFLRIPVGFALLLTGFIGYWYLDGLDPALATMSTIPYRLVTTYVGAEAFRTRGYGTQGGGGCPEHATRVPDCSGTLVR